MVWRGGRDAARASDDIEQVGDSGKKTQRSLRDGIQQAAVWGAAIAGAAYTAREAWQTIGEGAELELVEQRFDALAESIGTTGDRLTTKMREATGGMVSDAELVETASTIINTGLQDTEQGVVRLSRVIGELGLDMQQVILTMANDSKLRLDSLGLSVTDVEERQRELNDAGMAMSDAFDVAVLEQLEEKLALVGSAANTTAGDIRKIEADWANLSADFKRLLAGAAGPVLRTVSGRREEEMRAQARAIALASDSYAEFTRRAIETNAALAAVPHNFVTSGFYEQVRAQEAGARTTAMYAAEMALFVRGQEGANEATSESLDVMAMHEALLVDAQGSLRIYNAEAAEQARIEQQVAESVAAGQRAAAEALASTRERIAAQQEYNQAFAQGFVPALEEGTDAEYDFNQALLESLASLGAAPEVLNSAAFATGDYSAEAIEAAIQQRAMAVEVQKTAEAVVAGDMSVTEATAHLEDFWSQLQEDYKMTFDTGEIDGAIGQVETLIERLNSAAGTYEARVIVSSQGATGIYAEPTHQQHGGRHYPGEPYWVGEAGPELIVPDRSGTTIPNGEAMRMAGGGGRGANITINNRFTSVLNSPRQFERAQRQGLNRYSSDLLAG